MQNSEAEDGSDEPAEEEARLAWNNSRGGTVAHTAGAPGTKTLPALWIRAAKLNSHYWHTGQRGKSLLTFDWIGHLLLPRPPVPLQNRQWGASWRISRGPWEEV